MGHKLCTPPKEVFPDLLTFVAICDFSLYIPVHSNGNWLWLATHRDYIAKPGICLHDPYQHIALYLEEITF